MKKAVFFDRDGVINKPVIRQGQLYSPRKLEEFTLIEGVVECLLRLRLAGWLNIVVTNQPDIARGAVSTQVLNVINRHIKDVLAVDDIIVCPHDDTDNCDCRKPKPGMLLKAAQKWEIDLNKSFMIGDQWKDAEAGKEAGCISILIDYPYNAGAKADFRMSDLSSAVELILRNGAK